VQIELSFPMTAWRIAGHAVLLAVILLPSSEMLCAPVVAQTPAAGEESAVDFNNDLMPIFTRFGCNSGPCHGKSRGQGGFQLSLLGFDPDFDFDAIVKEGRGRRVFPGAAGHSLLLQKPTGATPHGGGRRLAEQTPEYQLLVSWIQQGMPRKAPDAPQLQKVTVAPDSLLLANGESRQLTVTAHYSDGTTRDVTRLTQFQSNESPVVAVDEAGRVEAGMITGEAAIMGRYMGQIAVCMVSVPMAGEVPAEFYAGLPRQNSIDDLVWKKLERLAITPSEVCDDHTFLRRAATDICGRVPTPEEVERVSGGFSRRIKEPHLLIGCCWNLILLITGPTNGWTCCGQIPITWASRPC
jgi:hypothetical protein